MATLSPSPVIAHAADFLLFADLFDYPGPAFATLLARAPEALAAASPVLSDLLRDFAARAAALSPAALEELYAATFDLQPDCTLNLGHHLFGEDHGKRSALLIELKPVADVAGLDLQGELPDHLCWLLRLLARTPPGSELQDLVPCCLLPSLRTLAARVPTDHLYQPLLQALYLLLADQPLAETFA